MAQRKSEFTIRCESVGMSPVTVRARMKKGMTLDEALDMPLQHNRSAIVYDRNRAQLVQADESWQAVRTCIKSLEGQVKMFERIIARIKEDPAGRKVYEQVMKAMVEGA